MPTDNNSEIVSDSQPLSEEPGPSGTRDDARRARRISTMAAIASVGLLVAAVVGLSMTVSTVDSAETGAGPSTSPLQETQVEGKQTEREAVTDGTTAGNAAGEKSKASPDDGDNKAEDSRADDEPTGERQGDSSEPNRPPPTLIGSRDRVLTIGTLLPESGDLDFINPAASAAAELAVEDINNAGGVLDRDVVLILGDSGDTRTNAANETIDTLLEEGVDAIVGAASNAVTRTVLPRTVELGLVQISPANADAALTELEDDGLYFRTAPSEMLLGTVLADLVHEDGNETATLVYRNDDYGVRLASSFWTHFERLGGVVPDQARIGYPTVSDSFDVVVDEIEAAGSDATIIIGFAESAKIVTALHERGLGPLAVPTYGVDGNSATLGTKVADPAILSSMKGIEASVDLSAIPDFTDRIDARRDVGGVYLYAPETYDAVVITALAALEARSDRPERLAEEMNDVTRGGTKCRSFKACRALIDDNEDFDYEGLGGPYDFTDAGEPSVASYRVLTYDGQDRPSIELDRYVIAGHPFTFPPVPENGLPTVPDN